MDHWPITSAAKDSIMPIAKINPEFRVNTTTSGLQGDSKVAVLADGRFVVTFTDLSSTGGDTSGGAIRGRIFNANGTQSVSEFLVNTTTSGPQFDSQVTALADGRFVVSWTSGNPYRKSVIAARIFNADGTSSGDEFPLAEVALTSAYSSHLTALPDGRFIASWTEWSTGITTHAGIFDANGAVSVAAFPVGAGTIFGESEVTALADGRFVVSWPSLTETGYDIRAQIFNADGAESGAEFTVNTTVANDQLGSSVAALADGSFVATWTDEGGTGGGDIRARIFNAAGTQSAAEFLVNTTTAGRQSRPEVTSLADGRFVVTWTDESGSVGDTSGAAVRARIFNADGTQSIPEFVVNTTVAYNQERSTVAAMADGRFVVTWTDFSVTGGDASGPAVRSQIFDPRLFEGTSDGDFVTGGSMSDQYFGYGGNDNISGQGGDDYLTGDAGSDTLNGGDGNDKLYGGADADFLFGGADNDTLNGGQGADVLVGGTGWNTASYRGGVGGVMVVMYSMDLNTGAAAGDTFVNINALEGSSFVDVLIGDSTANAIFGGEGGDWLDGSGGGDSLYGGTGNDSLVSRQQADVLDGGRDFDSVRYDFADAGVKAFLYDATQNTGWAAGDTFISIEGILGSYFDDDLRGNFGVNTLSGLSGDDFISGLGGSDLLEGGNGQDTFQFFRIGDGGVSGDTIQDFVSGIDRISVQGLLFGLESSGRPGGAPIDSFRFVAGTAANLATSQFIYNGATRQLFYDIDGTGAGAQVLLATLQAGATITAADIFVI
jgi:Ca2+-binding RTX toxin-like protein